MTDQELIDYYANLLIIQYRGKSKAYAHIQTLVTPVIMNQMPIAVEDAFDLETAVGVQLDVLGKYNGVTRNGYNFSEPVTLDDEDFRLFIKIAIAQNNGGSSLADIQNLLFLFFPQTLFIFDHQNMFIDYFVDSNEISSELVEFFVKAGKLPRPMGVGIGAIIVSPDITNFFSFRTYEMAAPIGTPFNNYDVYETDWPWLSYDNSLLI